MAHLLRHIKSFRLTFHAENKILSEASTNTRSLCLIQDFSIMYYETYKPVLKNGFTYQAFAQKDVVLPGFNILLPALNNSNKRRCRTKYGSGLLHRSPVFFTGSGTFYKSLLRGCRCVEDHLHPQKSVILKKAHRGKPLKNLIKHVMLRKAFRDSFGSICYRFFRSIPSGVCLRMTDRQILPEYPFGGVRQNDRSDVSP